MKLTDDVLTVLSAMECDRGFARITDGQLDRKLYVAVNKALEALGGVWNRKARAHVFPGAAAERLDAAIVAGEVTTASELGYFPTPPALAEELVRRAGVAPGMAVLEPSAGEGAIALAARAAGGVVTCCELDEGRFATLAKLGFTVRQQDFAREPPPNEMPGHGRFDRVVMNPPFARKQDIDHILHAFRFLRPGGLLVAVASAGVLFRADRRTQVFRGLVAVQDGTIEPLPDDSFRASGTGVRTVVVTIPLGDPA